MKHPAPKRHDVEQAAEILAPVFPPSPLQHAPRLSAIARREVFLKREDLNPVRSYKGRGAYVAVSKAKDAGATSVVSASAGNHAQGLAAACHALSIPAAVVVPSSTPRQKRDRIRHFGGDLVELIVTGRSYDDAAAYALELARQRDAALIPAFDHPHVIAGQGTVAQEILQQLADIDIHRATSIVPVGGGGLLAGSALALAGSLHSLIGVEPQGAASWNAALAANTPVRLDLLDAFVDGAAVAQAGGLPFRIVQPLGIPVLTVAEGHVATTMLELYQHEGIITEPAGALALAALEQVCNRAPVGPLVFVVSGGNNDVSRYAEVLERSLVHRGIKQYFLLEFDQVPGALRRFLDSALADGDDIVLFEYVKKSNRESGPALVGIELQSPDGLEPLQQRMTATGIRWERVEPGSALQRFLV